MACYDVFNGDADGICALQQLRLQTPRETTLITGLKREIDLLRRVTAAPGDEITVLDVSLDKNRDALSAVLEAGASVFYADHHFAGEIPLHENFDCHIDTSADTCTSLIVNGLQDGASARWAVVGAFGDNFDRPATELARSIGLDVSAIESLQQLGICLNYNGYGFELEDLLYNPADLYRLLRPYEDPLEFIAGESGYTRLLAQYEDDMSRARNVVAETESPVGAVYLLPNEGWSKRIVGVMGNELARRFPERAHALLVDMGDGNQRVSVRAPYNRKDGADELCRQFPSGGGRKAAAGINALATESLELFLERFDAQFGGKR
ncbi:MAG TPA: DHH family phosphoesterase [Gammaproteobacteria bacterium]|nr:DHH family phosphoesterase [Gammaproteobacteria bacterium]